MVYAFICLFERRKTVCFQSRNIVCLALGRCKSTCIYTCMYVCLLVFLLCWPSFVIIFVWVTVSVYFSWPQSFLLHFCTANRANNLSSPATTYKFFAYVHINTYIYIHMYEHLYYFKGVCASCYFVEKVKTYTYLPMTQCLSGQFVGHVSASLTRPKN